MSDEQAHEFYKDPEHLAIAGPGQRRERPTKTGTIPVRFTPEMIAAVKRLAGQDGVTVSTWIRAIVAREILRRQPPTTISAAITESVQLNYPAEFRPQSESVPTPVRELCIVLRSAAIHRATAARTYRPGESAQVLASSVGARFPAAGIA